MLENNLETRNSVLKIRETQWFFSSGKRRNWRHKPLSGKRGNQGNERNICC